MKVELSIGKILSFFDRGLTTEPWALRRVFAILADEYFAKQHAYFCRTYTVKSNITEHSGLERTLHTKITLRNILSVESNRTGLIFSS